MSDRFPVLLRVSGADAMAGVVVDAQQNGLSGFDPFTSRAPREEKLPRHGLHESNLANRDRRTTPRADADDREVGAHGNGPSSEATRL